MLGRRIFIKYYHPDASSNSIHLNCFYLLEPPIHHCWLNCIFYLIAHVQYVRVPFHGRPDSRSPSSNDRNGSRRSSSASSSSSSSKTSSSSRSSSSSSDGRRFEFSCFLELLFLLMWSGWLVEHLTKKFTNVATANSWAAKTANWEEYERIWRFFIVRYSPFCRTYFFVLAIFLLPIAFWIKLSKHRCFRNETFCAQYRWD